METRQVRAPIQKPRIKAEVRLPQAQAQGQVPIQKPRIKAEVRLPQAQAQGQKILEMEITVMVIQDRGHDTSRATIVGIISTETVT
jgi:hypothetical protein